MEKTVLQVLAKYIKKGDTIIVGVSGGPDSTALLDLVAKFSASTPCGIIVAHVNHGLRSSAANYDEKFTAVAAHNYGLKFESIRAKLKGVSLEEKGRNLRREFFESLLKKYKARWILTAHTLDDNAETIVFNFIRGAGLAGLSGMREANGVYLKPLLGVSKKEILEYLRRHKLKFRTDATNADTRFSRNFIRKRLMPLMEKLNPGLKKTLARNAEIFRAVSEKKENAAEKFLMDEGLGAGAGDGERAGKHGTGNRECNEFAISAKKFAGLPKSLQEAVLQRAFLEFTRQPYRLPAVKIEEILRMVRRNIGKKRIASGCTEFILDKGMLSLR